MPSRPAWAQQRGRRHLAAAGRDEPAHDVCLAIVAHLGHLGRRSPKPCIWCDLLRPQLLHCGMHWYGRGATSGNVVARAVPDRRAGHVLVLIHGPTFLRPQHSTAQHTFVAECHVSAQVGGQDGLRGPPDQLPSMSASLCPGVVLISVTLPWGGAEREFRQRLGIARVIPPLSHELWRPKASCSQQTPVADPLLLHPIDICPVWVPLLAAATPQRRRWHPAEGKAQRAAPSGCALLDPRRPRTQRPRDFV